LASVFQQVVLWWDLLMDTSASRLQQSKPFLQIDAIQPSNMV
jgi:hypothetical protein